MRYSDRSEIEVKVAISAPLEKVWECWTKPEHIVHWNFADVSWHCPRAENDLREGGQFSYRMEARDGSFGFDFGGTYTLLEPMKAIAYKLGDERKVKVAFSQDGDQTTVTEIFDPEMQNSRERQQQGWQAILMNFRDYVMKK